MGSAQSYLSPEAALTTAVVVGAVALGYTQFGDSAKSTSQGTSGQSGQKKNKKKKKAAGQAGDSIPEVGSSSNIPPAQTPVVVPFPAVIPGQFDDVPVLAPGERTAPKPKKAKKKKGKSVVDTPAAVSSADIHSDSSAGQSKAPVKRQASSSSRPVKQSTASIDTDGSWTRVEPRRTTTQESGAPAEITTSDAGITTSATGNSSPITDRTEDESFTRNTTHGENRKTLAEKLLPKPRKTGVDDMLETPDYPSLSRVMRVQPQADEKPPSGYSWADYEDVATTGAENDADGEDEGWGVVKSRGRSKIQHNASTSTQKAPETLTKRQRQNAQKRDAQKAAKAEGEEQRLATLAKHKKELERAKMIEQLAGPKGKTVGGGMKPIVDDRGKMVFVD